MRAWPAKEPEKEMLLNRSNMKEKLYLVSQMMTVFYKGIINSINFVSWTLAFPLYCIVQQAVSSKEPVMVA